MISTNRVILPTNVSPSLYELEFDVNLEAWSYRGKEKVHCEVKEATNTITIHSKDIQIHSVSFTTEQGQTTTPDHINFNLKRTTVSFVFEKDLAVGKGFLHIDFTGELNNQMAGFYRSSYTAINGEKRIMASTQFEPLDARRCFPCWDEPEIKAVFEITMIISQDRVGFSNMPEVESEMLKNGKRRIKFAPSPKMSTYLVALCVGEFDFAQRTTRHGVTIRVYTPPGKFAQANFSLGVACDTLDFYDDYFQIPYPLPKLDMVAVPEFAMGAMENWGLVTYREVDLLIDEQSASPQQKQRVCTVVTHELAHQWFGNLVTMLWWDDLWLNEGFASYMQNLAADALFPKWGMWEQYGGSEQMRALSLDSLRTSHPIQVPIAHAEEVEEVFDSISYAKGSCVIRMLAALIGPDHFQKGLQNYLKKYAYSNTVTADLWNAWAEVSGKPIAQIMKSWTEQMGFPFVAAKVLSQGPEGITLEIEQNWFLADGSELSEEEKKKTWSVPLLVSSKETLNPVVHLITEKKKTIVIPPKSNENDWILLNSGQKSLTRILYPKEWISQLARGIKTKEISAEDRAGLILDAHALSKVGNFEFVDLVRLIEGCGDEEKYVVWSAIEIVLNSISSYLPNEQISSIFSAFVLKLIKKAFSKIGWQAKKEDGHLDKMLRATLIRLLTAHSTKDNTDVVQETKRLFSSYINSPQGTSELLADYRVEVIRFVLRISDNDEENFQKLISYFGKLTNNVEKKHVMSSIGFLKSAEYKKKVLDWTMAEVLLQDFFYPMGSVSVSGPLGRDVAWNYFKDNFEKIKSKLGKASPSLMDAAFGSCAASLSTNEDADDIKNFFEKNPLPQSNRTILQKIEAVRIASKTKEKISKSPLAEASFWQSLNVE